MGLQPPRLGRLVAREAGLPPLVHIGEPPPMIEDVLDVLGRGDAVTYCYHGKTGHPWRPDGRPRRALERALARGVLLDVGHGPAAPGAADAGALARRRRRRPARDGVPAGSVPTAGRTYRDAGGAEIHPGTHVVPVATVTDGRPG